MRKNVNLKNFYNAVYTKGERKHFTTFIAQGTPTSESDEILNEVKWRGKKVLDVGCGTGLFAWNVAKKGGNVMGIDYSEVAIEIANTRPKVSNLKFEKIDVKEIKGKFDVIVSIGTLEHMDDPLKTLRIMKKHLLPKGRIIITSPNYTNPRGYFLMTLLHLFGSPVTLADLHYQSPLDFMNYGKKLDMKLKWRTIDKSWAHGEVLIKDFKRRIPNVLRDSKLPCNKKNIKKFIDWIEENVLPFNNDLPHSGATGLYNFSLKN